MNSDYRLPALESFINEILNPIHNESADLLPRYRLFHAVVYYFEYAAEMVRTQEKAIRNRETDALICGSAIAAYIFMHNCFILINKASNGISRRRELATKLAYVKKIYASVGTRAEQIRHAIGAHPEGARPGSDIATKRSMLGTDGRVRVGKFILHPREDLEKLRAYMERVGELLGVEWPLEMNN